MKQTVCGYSGYEDWRFEIETCWRHGQPQTQISAVLPAEPSGSVNDPPKHVLDRIVRLIAYGGGDLDSTIAFATAALPDPKYHRDPDVRAAVTAIIYGLEYERHAITRALGHAFGDERIFDTPRPRVAIGKAFDIPFGMTRNIHGENVIDESDPGKTVDNYIRLAHSRRGPTGEPYLPKSAHRESDAELEPVKQGPFAHREITLFYWRSPYEGQTLPGERIVGPHVIVEAYWTDPRRFLESREELPAIRLEAVCPAEELQHVMSIIRQLEDQYPGATVKAKGTLKSSPPGGYPVD